MAFFTGGGGSCTAFAIAPTLGGNHWKSSLALEALAGLATSWAYAATKLGAAIIRPWVTFFWLAHQFAVTPLWVVEALSHPVVEALAAWTNIAAVNAAGMDATATAARNLRMINLSLG